MSVQTRLRSKLTRPARQLIRFPAGKVLQRDLSNRVLNNAIAFLVECRPLSVSMGNAIKHLKTKASQLDPGLAEDKAKAALVVQLDSYIQVTSLCLPPISPAARAPLSNFAGGHRLVPGSHQSSKI